MFGPLEGDADVGSLLCSNGLSNNCLERPIFAVNACRKPERDAKAVAGALCTAEREMTREVR
jgi:hypothetical protein